MHNDGYVVTIHSDDIIAAGSQKSLDSLNHGKQLPYEIELHQTNGSQKSGKLLRGAVEFADGAHW